MDEDEDEDERDQEDEDVEELIHALVTNLDHQIPIGDYRMLLILYPLLNRVLGALTFMKSELYRLRGDVEQHDDYLDSLVNDYDGFNPGFIDPAIAKLNNILIPANIIIGLLSQPDYEIPLVDVHILETIKGLIQTIQTQIRTATPQQRQTILNEYYALITGFNPALLRDALTKIDRAFGPQVQSQSINGGKRKKTKNKKTKNKKTKKQKTFG